MLKKRILAIQAAVVLGVSALAATTIPVGNIATVEAARTRRTESFSTIKGDMEYGYWPGSLEIKKSSGTIKTNDTVRIKSADASDAATNYKEQISWYDDTAEKYIYGERAIKETVNISEGSIGIGGIWTYDADGTYTGSVDKANFAKYVTLSSDGQAKFIGTGRYEVEFVKYYTGTVTLSVTDVYEDGKTETDTLSSSGLPGYTYTDENGKDVDGFARYAWANVNNNDPTVKEFRNSNYYIGFPGTSWIYTNDDDPYYINVGESAVLYAYPYEPMNTSSVIYYSQYDPATDTNKRIMGTQTIVETITSGNPSDLKWEINAGGEAYVSVSGGVVKGLKAGSADIRPTVTITRSFKITNKWEDGVVETYSANEGVNDGKELTDTVDLRGSWIEVDVNDTENSYVEYYKKHRLFEVENEATFGAYEDTADEVVIGKGESKDVANSWGSYVPYDNSNDPYEMTYTYYDANGKKQKAKGQESYTETNVSIKHKYTSSDTKIVTVDEETGKITGVAPGIATITDNYTIKSTFAFTCKWEGKTEQKVTTGELLRNKSNHVTVTVVDAAVGIANGGTYKDATSKAEYIVYTKTKTASYKKPTSKSAKKYTVPAKIKVNGEEYTVNAIEDKAFAGLKKAQVITVNAPIKYMGEGVFSNTPKLTEVVMKAAKIDRITEGTFAKAKKLKKLTVNGNALNYIDEGAFDKNAKITVTVISKKKSAKKAVAEMFKDAGYTKFTIKLKKK